jgi:hypothetical protein
MKKPEWLVKLENVAAGILGTLTAHTNDADIHRTIHVSTEAPTDDVGEDGDIWLTIE